MPNSPFRQSAKVTNKKSDSALGQARDRIISSLSTYLWHGPTHASTCYVWPSVECPVGCGHCNYAAPMSLGGLRPYSVARDPEAVLRVMNGMGLWKAVLSGGGEPMVEPEFCERFVHEIDSPNLEEIELITAAHFASDEKETRLRLRRLVKAWRSRSVKQRRARLSVRISLDWFHAQRIGVEPAARVIRFLGEDDMREVNCYIRSVLLDGDTTFEQLSEALGGELGPISDYQQEIRLPDGRSILIYHKNLIVDGRMNQRKLSRLPVTIPVASRADVFGQRFLDNSGKQVPARVYNGPEVKHLDGLACLIEDTGAVRILEGNDPTRSPNVRDHRTWEEVIAHLYADPITVYLVEHGPQDLATLMSDAFPESLQIAADTNQLYHLTELLLDTPAKQLYATLRTLRVHTDERRVSAPSDVVDGGWKLLHAEGVVGRDGH